MLGAASGSTQIAGSSLVPPWDTTAFTFFGAAPVYGGTSYPGSSYFTGNGAGGVAGVYTSGSTTAPPWAVEFDFDTSDGLFEVSMMGKGAGGGVRILVNGQYVTAGNTFVSATSDGAPYLGKVTLAAAGVYRIRLEGEGQFWFGGIRTIPTNGITAAPKRTQRWIVIGDSFTEPTVSDTPSNKHQWDGYVQQLSYLLGVDAWSCGSGGTGYLKPFSGRVNFKDRLTDVTQNNPDVVVFAGGINDYASYTAAAIGAQALACFQQVKAALSKAQIIVLSPWWPRGAQTYASNLLATADAIKASAQQVGAMWVDVLRQDPPPAGANGGPAPAPTTLSASTTVGATQITTPVLYPLNTYMQIGSGTNAEVRKVSGTSGASAPYTLQFGGAHSPPEAAETSARHTRQGKPSPPLVRASTPAQATKAQ
jgi:lysophospholipase L1-like esterase